MQEPPSKLQAHWPAFATFLSVGALLSALGLVLAAGNAPVARDALPVWLGAMALVLNLLLVGAWMLLATPGGRLAARFDRR